MLFITEVFASAEMTYRRDRIRADFARVGGSPRAPRRHLRAHKVLGRTQRHVYRPVGAGC